MAKEISIIELTNRLKGTIAGNFDEGVRLTGTCAIDNYVENKVSFIRNRKYGEMLAHLQNAIVLVPENLADFCEKYHQNTYVVVEDVLNSLMDIQNFFYSSETIITEEGISPTAKADESAEIGRQAYIGENVYIGRNVVIGNKTKILHNSCLLDDVMIGNDTHIYPGVCIYKGSQIGNDCIIHSGAQVGVDGFRFEQDIERKLVRKLLHVGKATIGDRVEIGANSTVDRATFLNSATILSDDVKLDDQVHIGHNAKIGARTCIAAQTCISGSVELGEDVWIGAGITVSNGITIGSRATVLLNAVVAYDVPDDEVVSGFYAMPHRQWKRVWVKWKKQT